MRPKERSSHLFAQTRANAKMFEYNVEVADHISLSADPAKLFVLTIGILGELAFRISHEKGSLERSEIDSLIFSARFFDTYIQTKRSPTTEYESYLCLLSSSAYYLCNQPGNAIVLSGLSNDSVYSGDFGKVLLAILRDKEQEVDKGSWLSEISVIFYNFRKTGKDKELLRSEALSLQDKVYEGGSARELLLVDVLAAVVLLKIENSSWNSLPRYSDLSREVWQTSIKRDSFIKELWPSQKILGEKGVFRGESAVVQMPTSSGKTNASELIIRSSFLSSRIDFAVIVAPFRSLCSEISHSLNVAFAGEEVNIDEYTDVNQNDFLIEDHEKQIIILTPEKLLFVLRQDPEIAKRIGLVIFDEGHQFDNGRRGIVYELLLTSLKMMLPPTTQKILISAVIGNATEVATWLNQNSKVVVGKSPGTYRSVGFVSWKTERARLEFVNPINPDMREFYVPRLITPLLLEKKGRERKKRFFPENKTSSNDIALFLGLQLVENGSIAIFCGSKGTVGSIENTFIEICERNVQLPLPTSVSNRMEVEKLSQLIISNLGPDSTTGKNAMKGVFSHHGNTPRGVRLTIEYAMAEGLIKFIICTSTLAQGVNLPLRYLIVPSLYQANTELKVRDFQNLIGRAGRAGMYTEGSILFSNPGLFDKKKHWRLVQKLLNPENSEPCLSMLKSIFEPIRSDNVKRYVNISWKAYIKEYLIDASNIEDIIKEISKIRGYSEENVRKQITYKFILISAIESFLLSHWDDQQGGLSKKEIVNLANHTLAYSIAQPKERKKIRKLFKFIARKIRKEATTEEIRRAYGRTMYGLDDSKKIESWVKNNATMLINASDDLQTLSLFWPLFQKMIKEGMFVKFLEPELLKELAERWIGGQPFFVLHDSVESQKGKKKYGKTSTDFKIVDIVEVCEQGFSYQSSLLVGAALGFLHLLDEYDKDEHINRLQIFQKKLKYGLPTESSIFVYELGFADRGLALTIASAIDVPFSKKDTFEKMKASSHSIYSILGKYPSYFMNVFDTLLKKNSENPKL